MEKNNIPPETAEQAFAVFKKKWDKMGNKERQETLLNMIINLGYRMDILASIVSEIQEVKDMQSVIPPEVDDLINKGAPAKS